MRSNSDASTRQLECADSDCELGVYESSSIKEDSYELPELLSVSALIKHDPVNSTLTSGTGVVVMNSDLRNVAKEKVSSAALMVLPSRVGEYGSVCVPTHL